VNGCLNGVKEDSESRLRYVSDDEEWEDQNESYVRVDPDELPGERPAGPSNDERVG